MTRDLVLFGDWYNTYNLFSSISDLFNPFKNLLRDQLLLKINLLVEFKSLSLSLINLEPFIDKVSLWK